MLCYETTDSLIIKLGLKSLWICSSILVQFLVKLSIYMKERNYNISMDLAQFFSQIKYLYEGEKL